MIAVQVDSLIKQFGSFRAVDSISFEVYSGEIFGFLGANGAGKSTTIRMLCGILPPTSGKASVLGVDVFSNPHGVKMLIGYMSQKFSLYDDLSVEQNINFAAGIRKLAGSNLKRRKEKILSETGLMTNRHIRTHDLPGGIKQRLALSCSLIHDPKLIFLDEPTAGVDPASRRVFWDLIRDLKQQGRTIFVTSHYMDEVEQCDRIALMNRGRIDALDTPVNLRTKILPGQIFEVSGEDSVSIKKVLEAIKSQGEISRFDPFGRGFHVVSNSADLSKKTKSKLNSLHCKVNRISASLEDVFVYVIGHEQ